MTHIFICYSRADKDFVQRIAHHLEHRYRDGIWYDSAKIRGGDIWWEDEILRAIAGSTVFIYLLSNDSIRSPYCRAELDEARRWKKWVLPVIVRPKTDFPPDLHGLLGRIQYVNMEAGINGETINDLFAGIDNLLEKPAPPSAPLWPEPTPLPSKPTGSESPSLSLPSYPDVDLPSCRRILFFILVLVTLMVLLAFLLPRLNTGASTPFPAGFLGGASITANNQWTPQYQIFGSYEMALVPVGCFMMGSNDSVDDEQPAHEQCFDQPFWIDRYEVTNAQYGSEGYFKGSNRPRERVTWLEARDFCAQRGGRLPSEREWEYAARGPDGLIFPWGNDFVAENVIYFANTLYGTADVGSKVGGVSWVGVFDLSGNVWEWVNTIYDQERFRYPYRIDDGREGDFNTNGLRVLRGGSGMNISYMYAHRRISKLPSIHDNFVGFRCARSYQ